MSLRLWAAICAAVVVVGILENALFGSDSPGTAHVISVGFFLLGIAGLIGLLVVAIAAIARGVRLRTQR